MASFSIFHVFSAYCGERRKGERVSKGWGAGCSQPKRHLLGLNNTLDDYEYKLNGPATTLVRYQQTWASSSTRCLKGSMRNFPRPAPLIVPVPPAPPLYAERGLHVSVDPRPCVVSPLLE